MQRRTRRYTVALATILATSLVCLCLPAPSAAQTCGVRPPGSIKVWDLDDQQAGQMIEFVPDGIQGVDIRFPNALPFSNIQVDDVIDIPVTSMLPSGFRGTVQSQTSDPVSIVFNMNPKRIAGAVGRDVVGVTIEELSALPTTDPPEAFEAEGRVCDIEVEALGINQDHGPLSGDCQIPTGLDQAFRMEIVEGVEVNGVLSISPFNIEVDSNWEEGRMVDFSVLASGYINFTGEIIAEGEYELPSDPILGGKFPVARFQLSIQPIGDIVIDIDAETFLGVAGIIRAGMKAGFTSTAGLEFGIDWVEGSPPGVYASQGETNMQASPPELTEDTIADVSIYGGATLTLSTSVNYGGFLPVVGNELSITAQGTLNLCVDPQADPWWSISGTPQLYVDLTPQLLFADLGAFEFTAIEGPTETFFTSQTEFPFPAITSGTPRASLSAGPRVNTTDLIAGSALRWSKAFVGSADATVEETQPTADGGSITVAGETASSVIIKLDPFGNPEWQTRVTGVQLKGIRETASGSFVATGGINSPIVVKLDAAGNRVWSKIFGIAEGNANVVQLDVDPRDRESILLAGRMLVTALDPTEVAPFVLRVAPDGSAVSATRYGTLGETENIYDAIAMPDGGMALVGETSYDHPDHVVGSGFEAYVLRTSPDDSLYWSHMWSTNGADTLLAVAHAEDGGLVAVGKVHTSLYDLAARGLFLRYADDSAAPLTATSSGGAIGGSSRPSGTLFDELHGVTASDGGYFVTGKTPGENERAWVARLEETIKPSTQSIELQMVYSVHADGEKQEVWTDVHDLGDGLLIGGSGRDFGTRDPFKGKSMWISKLPAYSFMHWRPDTLTRNLYTNMLLSRQRKLLFLPDELFKKIEFDMSFLEDVAALTATGQDTSGSIRFEPATVTEVRLIQPGPLATTTTTTLGGTTTTTMLPGICGDTVAGGAPGSITASDALRALRVAVGQAQCLLCLCDVNGDGQIAASDALLILRSAVGESVTLNCPAC